MPLLLIILALALAALASYGTDPAWGASPRGLQLIYLTARLQVPLFALCLLTCGALIFFLIARRRRVWWLIGLLPVLALFGHRFATSPMRDFHVAANPPEVESSPDVRDADWVVGLTVNGNSYAYPFACLYQTPVVVQTLVENRLVVLWNAYANLPRAYLADRDLAPTEMEVISMPANALLVYNHRYGEFINGVTGKTRTGKNPTSFRRAIDVRMTSWAGWRADHPGTKLVLSADPRLGPAGPLQAKYKLPGDPPREPTLLIATTRPSAVPPTDISDRPVNLALDGQPTLIFRDPSTQQPRAFSRIIPTGQELRFAPLPGATPPAFMAETDSRLPFTVGGMLIEPKPDPKAKPDPNAKPGDALKPEWKGLRLTPLPVIEGPDLAVLKFWIPDLVTYHVQASDFAEIAPPPVPEPPPKPRPTRQRKKK